MNGDRNPTLHGVKESKSVFALHRTVGTKSRRAPSRVDVRRARSDTRQSVPRAFRYAPKCAARERLNFVSSIQIRDREFNDVNMDHMEAMCSMYPEWYDVIRQLNDDALENGFRA